MSELVFDTGSEIEQMEKVLLDLQHRAGTWRIPRSTALILLELLLAAQVPDTGVD